MLGLVEKYRTARIELILALYAFRERRLLSKARNIWDRAFVDERNPLVSVTIPTFNRGKLVAERTLPSVLSQTYQNLEIVVVGDCCTDDTEERIAKLNDVRIRYLNLPARGKYPKNAYHRWMVAGAKPINKALELAKGSWLAYLDDDEVFSPEHVEVLLEFATKGKYELVFGRYKYEESPGVWKEGGGGNIPHRLSEEESCCRDCPALIGNVPIIPIFF